MKPLIAIFITFSLLLCLFAGCGRASTGDHTPTGDGLSWDETTTPSNDDPIDDQVQELTLTYYEEHTMNPYQCTEYTNQALFSLLYQGLFVVDRNYNVSPLLCKNYKVSNGNSTYTFYPEAATFSDGSVLTAEDVAASLKAAKSSNIYKGRFHLVTSISVSSDGGVVVKLKTPYENFPLLLDLPIIKASEINSDRPLGTGPYKFEETPGGMQLRKRTDWWCSANLVVTAPYISLVKAKSTTQIRDEFQFGDVDMVYADPGSDSYADFRCDYELWDSENGIFLYLACSSKSAVFSNKAVRTALTHAINRELLADTYYRGFARAATLPASPLFPHYNTSLAEQYGYDAAKFTSVLEEQKLTGSTVVLLVNKDDSLRLRAARAIGEMLTQCGLVVKMKELNTSSYLSALKSQNYDLYFGQTKLSANMDLSAFFSTSGTLNYGGISNTSAYMLSLEALANTGNYYSLHKTVMDNGLLCPVLFRSYAVYTNRGVLSGMTPARDNVFYYTIGKSMADALIK